MKKGKAAGNEGQMKGVSRKQDVLGKENRIKGMKAVWMDSIPGEERRN